MLLVDQIQCSPESQSWKQNFQDFLFWCPTQKPNKRWNHSSKIRIGNLYVYVYPNASSDQMAIRLAFPTCTVQFFSSIALPDTWVVRVIQLCFHCHKQERAPWHPWWRAIQHWHYSLRSHRWRPSLQHLCIDHCHSLLSLWEFEDKSNHQNDLTFQN